MAPATQTARRVLVGDDQIDVQEALRLLLKGAGYQAETVDSPQALLRAAEHGSFDAILMDMNYTRDTTSGQEGLDLLARLRCAGSCAPVVVMTAWGSIDLAVEAMRRGAADFVLKPWDNQRLLRTLEKTMKDAAARKTEMEIARHVQQKLFPQKMKSLPTLALAGYCEAAREVGGDYYDYLDLGRDSIGLVLADVSGKGVASAILMANLQAQFRSQPLSAFRQPCDLLRVVNQLFYESSPSEHFVTLFFGQYDDRLRRLRYVNCGHPSPVLARRDGAIERLSPTAMVIGAFPRWSAEEAEVDIGPGDTVVMFSDGVIEAAREDGSEYGEDRLSALIQAARERDIETLIDRIHHSVRAFTGGVLTDDYTLVALRGL